MKLLKEALVDVKRLSDDQGSEDDPDLDIEAGLEDSTAEQGEQSPEDGDPDDLEVDNLDGDLELGDDASESDPPEQNTDADSPWGALDSSGGADGGSPEGDESGTDPNAQGDPETDGDVGAIADKASDDPDRQGLIRSVRGAHLVYKRESDSGYEELWLYNVTTLQDEMTIRKAILAGTDIPPNKSSSPDGSQTYKIWSAGNAEMLLISGLQN